MIQEVLVSPTAKLDISKLLKSSPSPSPPPSATSRPSYSRSFSVAANEGVTRGVTSPTPSTASLHSTSRLPSGPLTAPRHPSVGGQAPLLIPAPGSKRTASTSPQESRQASKKPTRQWSNADSDELLRLRNDNMKWEDIARHFPNRTSTACRLRYQNYLERKYNWTDEKKAKLARLYDRYNHDMWIGIAKELEVPWRAVEDMHWQIGQVDMANLAGARLLHPDRANDDQTPISPSMQSTFPPRGHTGAPGDFVTTPGGPFTGLPPAPGRILAQPPQPPTTNGGTMPRLVPGGDQSGFDFHRRNRRQGSLGGPLPSLAELNLPVSAYATPGGARHHDEAEEGEPDD